MVNPRSIDNLKPHQFKPGQSGNPKGGKRRRSLIDILKAELAKADGPAGETNGEYLVHRLVQQACHGNIKAAQLVLEYAEGKPEHPLRMVEEQIIAIAKAEGIEPRVLLARTRVYADRLA